MQQQYAATTRHRALRLPEVRNITSCIYAISVSCTKQAAALLYEDPVLFALVYDELGAQLALLGGSPSTPSPREKPAGQLGMLALCGDPGCQVDMMDTLYRTARMHALPVQLRSCFAAEV